MGRLMVSAFTALSILLVGPGSVLARDVDRLEQIRVVNALYTALGTPAVDGRNQAKAEELGALLTLDAQVNLTDLGITQTRQEFLDSLVEVDDALAGGGLIHRVEPVEGSSVTVLVCYEFASNTVLNREEVQFDESLISVINQTAIADNCDAL